VAPFIALSVGARPPPATFSGAQPRDLTGGSGELHGTLLGISKKQIDQLPGQPALWWQTPITTTTATPTVSHAKFMRIA
jgi:hypothetical protein